MSAVDPRTESTSEVEKALKSARIVCAALVAGVVVYAAVAWYLSRAGVVSPVDPATANLLRQVFVAVMLIGVLGWMVIWGRARAPTPWMARCSSPGAACHTCHSPGPDLRRIPLRPRNQPGAHPRRRSASGDKQVFHYRCS